MRLRSHLQSRVAQCRNYSSSACSVYDKTLLPRLSEQLKGIEDAGLYKRERILTSPQSSSIKVQSRQDEVLNFCANNYLGISLYKQKRQT